LNLPKSATAEWLSEVIDMTITASGNEFQIKRIEREARALLDKNVGQPEMCWLVLAFTAFLQGNRDDCIRCVEAASALAKYDVTILGNAATLVSDLGMPELGAKYARQLAALSQSDPRLAINAARSLYGVLLFEEAAEIMCVPSAESMLNRHDDFLRDLSDTITLFQTAGVHAELRVTLLKSATSIVRATGCEIRWARPVRYPDGAMRYEMFVEQSATQCASVDFAIAEALVGRFDEAYPELITFVCRPLGSLTPRGVSIEIER
jgi:hypothetical protein